MTDTTAKSGMLSKEEIDIICTYPLYLAMLTMVNNSIEDIKHSRNYMNRMLLSAAHTLYDLIDRDRAKIKQKMDDRNIRIEEDEHREVVIFYRIFFRGYEQRMGFTREVMKSRIRIMMADYMREIEQSLSKRLIFQSKSRNNRD